MFFQRIQIKKNFFGRGGGGGARVSDLFYKDRKSKKKISGWGSMRGLLARVSAFFSKESKSKKIFGGGGAGCWSR